MLTEADPTTIDDYDPSCCTLDDDPDADADDEDELELLELEDELEPLGLDESESLSTNHSSKPFLALALVFFEH
ncbi:hypothetical protein AGMMS49921_01240 [Endomicrobiia bacterium]|nr:hypothetical protein AGMMS49921_01240 [Endomicrobiia bacterium]